MVNAFYYFMACLLANVFTVYYLRFKLFLKQKQNKKKKTNIGLPIHISRIQFKKLLFLNFSFFQFNLTTNLAIFLAYF